MADPFDAPRRAPTFPRQPEELHIPAPSNPGAANNGPPQGQNQFPSPPEYSSTLPPSISIQHSANQLPGSNPPAASLPGALQPGNVAGRPASMISSSMAPTQPTLPQISTQPPPSTPSRSGQTQAHAYTRSSPSGFEQKYKPAGNTPDSFKSPQGFGPPSPMPKSTPYSPLGLAEIRQFMESGDEPGPMSQLNNGGQQYPTNSNYLAPWSAYALDWCKWPTRPNSNSVGKVALGSYLEDHHNYVSLGLFLERAWRVNYE